MGWNRHFFREANRCALCGTFHGYEESVGQTDFWFFVKVPKHRLMNLSVSLWRSSPPLHLWKCVWQNSLLCFPSCNILGNSGTDFLQGKRFSAKMAVSFNGTFGWCKWVMVKSNSFATVWVFPFAPFCTPQRALCLCCSLRPHPTSMVTQGRRKIRKDFTRAKWNWGGGWVWFYLILHLEMLILL